MNDDVFTLKEAAQYLRISEMTILRLVHRGVFPGMRVGRQWRFSKGAILEKLHSCAPNQKQGEDYVAFFSA